MLDEASGDIRWAVQLLGIVRTEREPYIVRFNVVSSFLRVESSWRIKLNYAMNRQARS